ncbi:MAG TPA: DNA polymerase III subunit chi [Patescibacteria group bacterium]|nr:DNA polymerase III subunit chi [Patescibacteria group bacterium]
MTDVRFYHLQSKRLEQALPEIVAKALERKYRVVIKAGSRERVEALDNALWTYDPGSFLPHGYVKDGFEAEQPVWLTDEEHNPNSATVLILTDGASSAKVADYTLCCEIFDGNDEQAVAEARGRWKSYKDAGHATTYFQQDDAGKWQQK